MKYGGEAGARRVTIKSLSTACFCMVGAAHAEAVRDRVRVKAGLVDCRPRAVTSLAPAVTKIKRGEHHKSGGRMEAIAWIQV